MFPRFLMSETHAEVRPAHVQRLGARRLPEGVLAQRAVWELWPQVAVLLGLATVFLLAARARSRGGGKRRDVITSERPARLKPATIAW